jgi:hypothetical protein
MVLEGDYISSFIFKSLAAVVKPGVSFYVYWEIVCPSPDDSGWFCVVDKCVDGCQGGGFGSLTCVTLQVGR